LCTRVILFGLALLCFVFVLSLKCDGNDPKTT
jgi:hypothetical protein